MLPNQPVKWRFISGLNRVNESAAKELLLAQITENDNQESSAAELITTNQTVKQKLKNIGVKEVLLRRWVPSQDREISDPISNQQIKLDDEIWKETEI